MGGTSYTGVRKTWVSEWWIRINSGTPSQSAFSEDKEPKVKLRRPLKLNWQSSVVQPVDNTRHAAGRTRRHVIERRLESSPVPLEGQPMGAAGRGPIMSNSRRDDSGDDEGGEDNLETMPVIPNSPGPGVPHLARYLGLGTRWISPS